MSRASGILALRQAKTPPLGRMPPRHVMFNPRHSESRHFRRTESKPPRCSRSPPESHTESDFQGMEIDLTRSLFCASPPLEHENHSSKLTLRSRWTSHEHADSHEQSGLLTSKANHLCARDNFTNKRTRDMLDNPMMWTQRLLGFCCCI